MKKVILLSILCASVFYGNAQVKIANNGNTLFGYPTSYTPISPISVNCEGRKDSKVTIQGTEVGLYTKRTGNAHWGNAIHSVSENPNVTFSVGVKAEAYHLSPLGQGVRLVFSEQQEMQHQDGIMAFLGVCRETRMVQESMEQSHTMRMEWILGEICGLLQWTN